METISNEPNVPLSDYAVLIKKMRLLKKLTRQQAELLFDFTYKNIEKLENGLGNITAERFRDFQQKYGFSDLEVEELRTCKLEVRADCRPRQDKITTAGRNNRRFCHRRITRECKALKEMRLMKNLDQGSASRLCGMGEKIIGFIENGRISLAEEKIRHIVASYGLTMELFNQLLRVSPLRHELIEQCQVIIERMDENKLRIVMPMLRSMS